MLNRKFNESLVFFSIIMIPLLALLFGLKESPFQYTFSMIGNWFDNKAIFIVWGMVTALLLLIAIIHIYQKTSFKDKRAYRFVYLSLLFLVLTVLTPTVYNDPWHHEIRERALSFNAHGLFGVLFAVFLVVSLFLFSQYLSLINQKLSIKSVSWLLITVGGSLLFLFLFGMTGIFEIFFFVSLSIFLMVINQFLKKNPV